MPGSFPGPPEEVEGFYISYSSPSTEHSAWQTRSLDPHPCATLPGASRMHVPGGGVGGAPGVGVGPRNLRFKDSFCSRLLCQLEQDDQLLCRVSSSAEFVKILSPHALQGGCSEKT